MLVILTVICVPCMARYEEKKAGQMTRVLRDPVEDTLMPKLSETVFTNWFCRFCLSVN